MEDDGEEKLFRYEVKEAAGKYSAEIDEQKTTSW